MDPPASSYFDASSTDNDENNDDNQKQGEEEHVDSQPMNGIDTSITTDETIGGIPIVTASFASATLVDEGTNSSSMNHDNNDMNSTNNNNTNANDDTNYMRTSISAAIQNYQENVVRVGGREMTCKDSVLSSRNVIVQSIRPSSSSATHTNPSNNSTSTTPVPTTTPTIPIATPIIATVVPDSINNNSNNTHATNNKNTNDHEKYAMMEQRLVTELGYPHGLAQRLVHCIQTQFVKHYWIVDNSGSMLTNDCVRMVINSNNNNDNNGLGISNNNHLETGTGTRPGTTKQNSQKKLYDVVKCSRWNELESALMSHIDLASILEVPTTFRLLKSTGGLMQEFTINQTDNDIETAKSILHQSEPDGVSLLSDHIDEICKRIEQDKETLQRNGQKVAVVIATDGLPSDQFGESSTAAKEAFAKSLQALQLLPVWIVIRLCTNDRAAVQYYRKLDKKLEIPIECVSNYISESKEVRKWNPWLNYTKQLHQCREMGIHHRVFDLLDERPYTKDDLHAFLMILFGTELMSKAPDIHLSWNDYLNYIKNNVLIQYEKQYSPCTKQFDELIDIKGLVHAHGIRGSIRNTFIR